MGTFTKFVYGRCCQLRQYDVNRFYCVSMLPCLHHTVSRNVTMSMITGFNEVSLWAVAPAMMLWTMITLKFYNFTWCLWLSLLILLLAFTCPYVYWESLLVTDNGPLVPFSNNLTTVWMLRWRICIPLLACYHCLEGSKYTNLKHLIAIYMLRRTCNHNWGYCSLIKTNNNLLIIRIMKKKTQLREY